MESDDGPLPIVLAYKGRDDEGLQRGPCASENLLDKRTKLLRKPQSDEITMRIIHGPGGCLWGGRHLQSLPEKRQDKIQRDPFFLFVAKTVFLKTGNIRWVASSSFAKNCFPENK